MFKYQKVASSKFISRCTPPNFLPRLPYYYMIFNVLFLPPYFPYNNYSQFNPLFLLLEKNPILFSSFQYDQKTYPLPFSRRSQQHLKGQIILPKCFGLSSWQSWQRQSLVWCWFLWSSSCLSLYKRTILPCWCLQRTTQWWHSEPTFWVMLECGRLGKNEVKIRKQWDRFHVGAKIILWRSTRRTVQDVLQGSLWEQHWNESNDKRRRLVL